METKVYQKSGCNNCVHATSKYDWIDGKYTLIERKCLFGNTDKLINWWEDNGHKKSGEDLERELIKQDQDRKGKLDLAAANAHFKGKAE